MYELIVGAGVTVLVQLIKKLTNKLGSNWTILLVALLTLIGAYGFYWGKELVTADILATWGQVVGYQYIAWGFVVKYLWPKVKESYSK